MNNFQLYSTDVLLGGQTCLDIIIDEKDSHTTISDFHISPINKRIPFNIDYDEYLLNSTHEENIQNFYKKIKKYFYDGYIDPKINSLFPYIQSDEENKTILHNNIYEMGCEYVEKYKYNKSFEILCPIWIEHLGINDKLSFDLIIKNKNTNKSTDRVLGKINIPFYSTDFSTQYHNNFVKYFRNYINKSGLETGSDRVINIDLENNKFSIKGLNVATGNIDTKVDNIFLKNLLYRERPLLEFDNMIINNFKHNQMVTNQLFNFRFYFDIEDIIYQIILQNDLKFKDFIISIRAKINDQELPMRDFYTNYEFIQKKYCTFDYNNKSNNIELNALDYLKDNQCIDLIGKNKLYCPTIHWSLCDNNNYIFNLYGGFAGYSNNNNSIINHNELYQDSPNLNQFKYYEDLNNINWCNCIDFNNDNFEILLPKRIELENVHHISFDEFYKYKSLINDKFAINIIQEQWNKNIKYKKYPIGLQKKDYIKILSFYISNGKNSNQKDNLNIFKTNIFNKYSNNQKYIFDLSNINNIIWGENSNIYIIYDKTKNNENIIYFFSDNLNTLTFASIKSMLSWFKHNKVITSIDFNYSLLKLEERLNMVIDPKYIEFTRSLNASKAKSPSQFTSEIIYYKNNDTSKKIYRYDGNIKPTFLSEKDSMEKNIFYFRNIIPIKDKLKLQKYNEYIKYSYLPIYPSIEFNGIDAGKLIYDPNIINHDYIGEILKDKYEYKWYNNSKILYLPNELNIILTLNNYLSDEQFENEIYNEVIKIYNINKNLKNIIKNKYIYTILSDEQRIEGKQIIYIYQIKLILK